MNLYDKVTEGVKKLPLNEATTIHVKRSKNTMSEAEVERMRELQARWKPGGLSPSRVRNETTTMAG